jgi:hypothetical protein
MNERGLSLARNPYEYWLSAHAGFVAHGGRNQQQYVPPMKRSSLAAKAIFQSICHADLPFSLGKFILRIIQKRSGLSEA